MLSGANRIVQTLKNINQQLKFIFDQIYICQYSFMTGQLSKLK